MCYIVLRWTDFLQIYSSVFLASKQLPSWHDGSYRAAIECSFSSLFGFFLVFWHLGLCLDAFSCFFPAMEVPQQTQNSEIDLNDDQDDDVLDVEEDDIPDVEDENVQERQERHAAERRLYPTDHMDRFIIEPSGNSFLPNIPPANVIKEIIQLKYKKLWTSYGKLSENDKLDWFQMFMGKCTWDERDHGIIERNFHIRAAAHMSDILRQVRRKFKKKGIAPQWICPKLFKGLQAYWESSEFVDVSNKAKKNRASEKGGCIYAGGSISVAKHGRRLANKLGRKPFIDELHLETHTNSKGGFVDERSRKVQEEYKKKLVIAIQDDSRQVDESLSLKTWSNVVGGKRKGRLYGAGNLAATYRKGVRTLHIKIADGEGTSQPPTLTPDMQEMIRKLAHNEALVKQMLLKQQSFDEKLQQEQARSQKLQQELSQLKSKSRQTPGVEDPEDDSPYPIYGEEEEEEDEEEEEEEEEDEDVEA
ncbi:hypothetical protein QL285_070491 [Trifolium repens]|nr:hypothetical protein QL285_070491 [Trifolium repens]